MKGIDTFLNAVDSVFSNGLNERLNQTLVNKIKYRINENKNKMAYTTIAQEQVNKCYQTEHAITGFAPKYLMKGRSVNIKKKKIENKMQNQRPGERPEKSITKYEDVLQVKCKTI